MVDVQAHSASNWTQTYPRLFMLWQSRGVSARASSVLALTNVDTAERIAQLGRAYFEGLPNCGSKTLAELAQLAGWPAKTPRDAIAQVLRLSLSGGVSPNPRKFR